MKVTLASEKPALKIKEYQLERSDFLYFSGSTRSAIRLQLRRVETELAQNPFWMRVLPPLRELLHTRMEVRKGALKRAETIFLDLEQDLARLQAEAQQEAREGSTPTIKSLDTGSKVLETSEILQEAAIKYPWPVTDENRDEIFALAMNVEQKRRDDDLDPHRRLTVIIEEIPARKAIH